LEGEVVLAGTPGVVIQRDVPAKMRDGTTLMSNVYRPADTGEYPVLLTRLPYGKGLPLGTSVLDPVKAAEAGYLVVVQDVRGRYRSEGKYENVDAPTFHIGGWYDCFIGETLRQYTAMKERSREAGIRPPHLMVGPWTHGDFGSIQGDLDFGIGSSGLFLYYSGDLTDVHLHWFGATLKEDESALEDSPPVQVFVMGENRWRGYDEWPAPGSREQEWYLRSDGSLHRETGGAG